MSIYYLNMDIIVKKNRFMAFCHRQNGLIDGKMSENKEILSILKNANRSVYWQSVELTLLKNMERDLYWPTT